MATQGRQAAGVLIVALAACAGSRGAVAPAASSRPRSPPAASTPSASASSLSAGSAAPSAGSAAPSSAAPTDPPSATTSRDFRGPEPSLSMSCEKGLAHKVELRARIDPSLRKRLVAAQVVSCASSSNLGPALTNQQYFLALQTPAGWFVRYLGEDGTVCGFEKAVSVRYRPHSLRTKDGHVQLYLEPHDAKDPPALCCSIADSGLPVCGASGLCE